MLRIDVFRSMPAPLVVAVESPGIALSGSSLFCVSPDLSTLGSRLRSRLGPPSPLRTRMRLGLDADGCNCVLYSPLELFRPVHLFSLCTRPSPGRYSGCEADWRLDLTMMYMTTLRAIIMRTMMPICGESQLQWPGSVVRSLSAQVWNLQPQMPWHHHSYRSQSPGLNLVSGTDVCVSERVPRLPPRVGASCLGRMRRELGVLGVGGYIES
jgi:hypothetical protein